MLCTRHSAQQSRRHRPTSFQIFSSPNHHRATPHACIWLPRGRRLQYAVTCLVTGATDLRMPPTNCSLSISCLSKHACSPPPLPRCLSAPGLQAIICMNLRCMNLRKASDTLHVPCRSGSTSSVYEVQSCRFGATSRPQRGRPNTLQPL
jgi:hypothetical protein